MKPIDYLIEGKSILDPYLNENGFVFTLGTFGLSSGGEYASGIYKKEDRFIELHYRTGLGVIKYHLAEHELDHIDYMKLLKTRGKNHYPGFSKDRLEAFKDLLFDLRTFATDFVSGSGREFIDLSIKLEKNPKLFKGFKGI
jgi:hypothetical protein